MRGRRVDWFPGWPKGQAQPGDYCRVPDGTYPWGDGWWNVCAPDGSIGSLSPQVHRVDEHEDGTITVSPSIVMRSGWHGWLRRGVWSSV